MEGAACARSGGDPEVFFTADQFSHPGLSTNDLDNINLKRRRISLAICGGCPVREQCLEEHLTEPYGIFGGLIPSQRKALAVKRGLEFAPREDYDFAVVERVMEGEDIKLRRPDKAEVVKRMAAAGATWDEVAHVAKVGGDVQAMMRQAAAA